MSIMCNPLGHLVNHRVLIISCIETGLFFFSGCDYYFVFNSWWLSGGTWILKQVSGSASAQKGLMLLLITLWHPNLFAMCPVKYNGLAANPQVEGTHICTCPGPTKQRFWLNLPAASVTVNSDDCSYLYHFTLAYNSTLPLLAASRLGFV